MMATRRAEAFVQRVQADKGLQDKLGSIEADTKDAMVKEMARIASEAGFLLTNEEVAAAIKEESEVSDAQLDHVVGGLTNLSFAPRTVVPVSPPSEEEATGVEPGHAYTVVGTTNVGGNTYVVMRNPWGSA